MSAQGHERARPGTFLGKSFSSPPAGASALSLEIGAPCSIDRGAHSYGARCLNALPVPALASRNGFCPLVRVRLEPHFQACGDARGVQGRELTEGHSGIDLEVYFPDRTAGTQAPIATELCCLDVRAFSP
jgi:hypothetical protein